MMRIQMYYFRGKKFNTITFRIDSISYRIIDKLPHTIEDAAKEIHKLTGWACTIIVGGPMPKQGGVRGVRALDQVEFQGGYLQ